MLSKYMNILIIRTACILSALFFLSQLTSCQHPGGVKLPHIVTPSGVEMIQIPPGEFIMGSPDDEIDRSANEEPHKVTITKPFLMAKTEVTVKMYLDFVKEVRTNPPAWASRELIAQATRCNKYYKLGSALNSPDFPIVGVAWNDAAVFVNWLSKKDGYKQCYYLKDDGEYEWDRSCDGYRLPTEAEWEYAARAGTTTAFFGAPRGVTEYLEGCVEDPNLNDLSWYCKNSDGHPHKVATKKPNNWGLYDMAGNVWEWTWDWHYKYGTEPVVDPQGGPPGKVKIFRGGSWHAAAAHHRCASRAANSTHHRCFGIGFRLARSVIQP